MSGADLHLHTTCSDGTFSIRDLVSRAKRRKVAAISITDHDYCESLDEIERWCDHYGVETISGTEISTVKNGSELHLLGYGFDPDHRPLKRELIKIRKSRTARAEKMVKNLQRIFKLDINMNDVTKLTTSNIGRPHIARALVNKGLVSDVNTAFVKYLNNESPAYVGKYTVDTSRAIQLLHDAGGVAVLAHLSRYPDWQMIDDLVADGLDGLELQHPSHNLELKAKIESFARRRKLLLTGGSDFHGGRSPSNDIGSEMVPYEFFEFLRDRVNKRMEITVK